MAEPLIKSVNHTRRVQDALKKPESQKKQKPQPDPQNQKQKDSKRIIDTYA